MLKNNNEIQRPQSQTIVNYSAIWDLTRIIFAYVFQMYQSVKFIFV